MDLMRRIKSRRTSLEEMFVLGLVATAVAFSSVARIMTLELWSLLVVTTIISLAASAAAAGRNNRRWFVVSAWAVLLFCVLLVVRFT